MTGRRKQRKIAYAALACALSASAGRGEDWFRDVTADRGVTFRHEDGRSGEKYYPETMASGGGFLDADGDGDLDLYLINGDETPGRKLAPKPTSALYENRGGRFVDVTAKAGVGGPGYGMGMCVGDVDGDGHLDFLVTHYGPDRLYRGRGDGTFEEIATRAGVDDRRWSAGCTFGDIDGDGDLDLYVAHYVDFAYERNPFCGRPERRAYCLPEAFVGVPDSLFRNRGDGTFEEIGRAAGIVHAESEKSLGTAFVDVDGDGDLDLYVANDGAMNRLYVNDGHGRFEDEGLISGAGLNRSGAPEASMGVAVGDLDGDLDLDLVLSHFAMETNTLYRNLGERFFDDATAASGLGPPSVRKVGWGIALFDGDNDGDLDLAVANGHILDGVERDEPTLRYRQPNLLFENDGTGEFHDRSAQGGTGFTDERVSRGLAVGDWNDDGRLDLLITNTNDVPNLLENMRRTAHRWLGIRLVGPPANRFAIGARVELLAGERRLLREVRSGGSFLTQSDLRVHFGLGTYRGPVEVVVQWPDGTRQTARTAELDRYWTIAWEPRP